MRSTGLSHLTFIVSDLDRMEHVLTTVLGAVRVYDSGSDTFSLSEERFDGEGDSIYFHDHDGHLFELHAGSLRERLTVYSAAAQSSDTRM